MLAFSSELLSWLAGRFRRRSELELEVIALRHQLSVLHRQRPGRATIGEQESGTTGGQAFIAMMQATDFWDGDDSSELPG